MTFGRMLHATSTPFKKALREKSRHGWLRKEAIYHSAIGGKSDVDYSANILKAKVIEEECT